MIRLEDRRVRLSFMVRPVDALSPAEPVKGWIQFGVKGHRRKPIRHSLGYWLFLNVPPGPQTLQWNAEHYMPGEIAVVLDAQPPRTPPLVEPRLAPIGSPAITLAELPPGRKGKAYDTVVTVEGGKPPFTFTCTPLPAGLAFDPARGAITGTPTTTRPKGVAVTVTVIDGAGLKADRTFLLKISL